MGAPGRTARRLKAGLAALFLITLAAALAPQDAQAQDADTPALTATAGAGSVTLTWTRAGALNRGGFQNWYYRQKAAGGNYGSWIRISGGVTIRSHTVTSLTLGTAYTFQVGRGNVFAGSLTIFTGGGGYSNEASATPSSKTITLSAASTSITEGDSGFTDVTVTVTLGEPAPANFSVTLTSDLTLGTAKGSSKGINPCAAPLNPADTDWCWGAGSSIISIAEGATQGTRTLRILGDTREEPDETIRLLAYGTGWNSGRLTLTITDDDGVAPGTVSVTATPNDGWVDISASVSGLGNPVVRWSIRWVVDGITYGWYTLGSGTPGVTGSIKHDANQHTASFSLSTTNGKKYSYQLVAHESNTGNQHTNVIANRGWAEATPRAETPTLVSTPSRTLTVTSGGTVQACFNLLSVTTATSTYLESRPGRTARTAHAALSHSAHGVRVSSNIAGVQTGVGRNLYPCPTLGVGVHTVRWHWKGHDGTAATEGTAITTFTVVQVPGQPNLNSASGSQGAVLLGWVQLNDASITGWEYQYKEGTGSYGSWAAIGGSLGTTGTLVTGLKPGTTYTFRVRARNAAGAGAASGERSATTEASPVPAAPAGFAASPGSTKVWLTWTAPDDASITGWEYQQKAGTGSYGSWTAIPGSTAAKAYAEVTGLTNDTAYAFKLRAVSDAGNGTASAEQTATPGAAVAAALTGEAGANGAHNLTWTTTSGGPHRIVINADVIGFWYAYYRNRGSTSWRGPSHTGGAGTRQWSGSGSLHGEVYEYYVQPVGSRFVGGGLFSLNGPDSNVIELTTNRPDRPALTFADAPVTVSPGTTATYTVKLNGAFAGTLALSSSAAGKARVSPSSLTFTGANYNVAQAVTVTGVAAGTATINHAFTLTGASTTFIPDAGTVSVTVGSGGGQVPPKPAGLTASAGNGQAVLSWTDPNNASITGYKLRHGKTGARGSAAWTAIPGSGAATVIHTVTGLDNDAEYSFKLRAVNAAGDGAATDWKTATPSATTAKPAKPVLTAAAGDGSVTLSWGAQANVSIWGYQYKSGAGSWGATRTVSGSATSATVTGLTNGTAYTFRLFARRGSGASAVQSVWSDEVTATPVGVVVSKSALTVAEGASGAYTVKLTTAPSATVTVTVGGASGDVAVSPPSLTFTTSNYGTAQTVTVSAAQDPDGDTDPDVTLTHSASGGGYGSVSVDSVVVTVTEDDTKGVTVSSGALTVDEGGTGSYTVALDTQPSGEVVVTVGGASGDVTVPDSQLRFAVNNWSTAQTVTVNAALDADADTDPDVTLTHSAAGGGYGSVTIGNVVVSVTESVSLPAAPTGLTAAAGNGQVALTWSNPNNASITGYELGHGKTGVRASAAWTAIPGAGATTTTHTVTGLDNGSEYSFRLRAVNPAGNGAGTGWATATPLAPTVPGVTVSTAALRVAEGGSGSYTVRLDTAPSDDVTVTVGGTSGDVTVADATLTFTTLNWTTPQTVTVNAGTDTDTDTDPDVTLTHSASGGGYGSVSIASVVVSVVDSGVAPAKPTGLAGAAGSGQVTLSWTDLANPTVTKWQYRQKAGSGEWGEWTDIPRSGAGATRHVVSGLTGGATYQFEVRAVNAAGPGPGPDAPARVTLPAASGGGPATTPPTTPTPPATGGRVTVTPTALTVAEGDSGSYTVALDTQPSGDVTVTVGGASGDVTTSPASLTFTSTNYNTAQTVTVTVAEDDDAVTDPAVTLTHSASGGGYGSVSIASVVVSVSESSVAPAKPTGLAATVGDGSVTLSWTDPNNPTITQWQYRQKTGDGAWGEWTDMDGSGATTTRYEVSGLTNGTAYQFEVRAVNEAGNGAGPDAPVSATPTAPTTPPATPIAGVTVTPTALTVAEGDSGSYTVALDTQPSGDVTVTIRGASVDVTTSPASLTFTSTNYNTAQTVIVTAAEDDDAVTDPAVTLTHRASGGGYGSVRIDAVTVTIDEDDEAGATLSVSSLTIQEGNSGNYTVVLDSQPTDEVTVTIGGASGDVTASPSSLTFTSANYAVAQTVTVTVAPDDDAVTDGLVRLTHSASGGDYDAVSIAPVTVTVREDDEAGVTLSRLSLALDEGESSRYTVVLGSQPVGGEVTVTPASADSSVLTVAPTALRFTATNWNTAQMVTVTSTRDDDTDDETVSVSHAVSGGDYEGVGAPSVTVTVTDTTAAERAGRANRVNARVLPQVAAATLSQTLTAVTERIGAVASGQPGASLQFGALPTQTLEEKWGFLPRSEPSTPSVSEMLDGATFALPLQMSGNSTAIQPPRLALWGRGERVSLSGTEEEVSWDGGLWSAHLGADMHIRPDLLAGAALSYGEGEVDTQTTERDGSRIAGTYETTLTAIHPYVSHMLADGSHLWGSMGYGQGEVRIREGSATRKTDLSQWSVALGGRRVLLEEAGRIAGGITRIALKGEGALAQLDTDAQEELTELTVKTTRLRLLLEGSHERALEGDATLTPALEAGLRHDGGDLGSGLGLEAGASLTWRNPRSGWLAELRARSLLAHEKDRDEWGISALVRVEPAADGRGLSLTFGPEYGHTDSGMERWFDYRLSPATANSATRDDRESRLEAELGYGIGVSRTGAMALLTPYTGFSLGQSGAETFRVGARYRLGEGLSVGIEGKHQAQAVGENSLMLRAAIRW